MKKKELLKKEELAEQLGMKFEEASELFSDETLETMRMGNITGGADTESTTGDFNFICLKDNCDCDVTCHSTDCEDVNGTCKTKESTDCSVVVSIEPPEITPITSEPPAIPDITTR